MIAGSEEDPQKNGSGQEAHGSGGWVLDNGRCHGYCDYLLLCMYVCVCMCVLTVFPGNGGDVWCQVRVPPRQSQVTLFAMVTAGELSKRAGISRFL